MKIIGQNIQYERELKKLDQDQMGALAYGYSLPQQKNAAQKRISGIETGNKEPSASDLLRLSHALKVDMSIFFNGTSFLVRPNKPSK